MRRRYILNVILLLLPFSGLVAQSGSEIFEQKASFESLTDSEDYNDVCVQDDGGVYHAINGAKRIVELSSEDYTIEWMYPTIIINGEETHIDAGEQKNLISYEIENSGRYRLRLDSVKWISKDGMRDSICRNLDIDNFDIELHEAPHITRNDIEGRSKEVIWDNTIRELLVEYEGGNTSTSGWTFVWKLGEDIVSGVSTNVWKRPIEKVGSQTLTLEIKNIAPNGETPWFERSFSCDFQVYRYPKDDEVKLMFRDKECPESMDWYCEDTSTDEISISTRDEEGDNWRYEWKYAGNTVSTEKSFRPSMTDDEVASYDKGKEYSYTVIVTNQPEGMAKSLAYYDSTYVGVVSFWKTPRLTLSYDDYKVVFDSTDVIVDINVEGGIPKYESTLSLSFNDEAISMSEESLEQIKFRSSVSDHKEDRRYLLTICFSNEQTSVEPEKLPIELTVWKRPVVELLYKSNNTALGESNPVIEDEPIYVCEKFGGKVELLAKTKDGDDEGWIYSWRELKNKGDTISTKSKEILVEEADSVADFELEIINRPRGMKKDSLQFKEIIPFKVEVCPTPSINLESIKSVYAGKHGDPLTLELGDNAIGKGGKWIYQWQKDGDKEPLELKTLTLSLKNTKDSVISEKWTARPSYCGPLGDVWYGDDEDESKSFSVNIYPKPDERTMNFRGFDEPRLDAFYGGTTTYDIEFDGKYRYAEKWVYEIKYNDETKVDTIASSVSSYKLYKIIPDSIVDGTSHSKTNVHLSVKCLVRDEDADTIIVVYSDAKSLDYYAWRKGEVVQIDYNKYAYFDDKVDLKTETRFGYVPEGTDAVAKGGWEYVWTLDGAVVGNDESYSYVCKNETSATTLTYRLHCRNVLNGEVGTDSIFYYTFDEYAKIEDSIRVEELYNENMREGDVVTIKAIANLQKGNPEGWRYKWNDVDMGGIKDEIPAKDFECLMQSSGNSMKTEDVTYTLFCYNYGPDGRYLGKMDRGFPVKIHRKPKVSGFRKKGNGTSNIYIAVSPSQDAKFEFGYGNQPQLNADAEQQYLDGIGDDDVKHFNENDDNYYLPYRYSLPPTLPWARTFWDYDDGFRCYSDVRSVELKVSSYSRELKIEDGYFYVNLEEEMPATVVLYTLDGKEVWEQQYAPQKDYNEHLDFKGITSGIYMLKCVVGEQQVVRKIVVR